MATVSQTLLRPVFLPFLLCGLTGCVTLPGHVEKEEKPLVGIPCQIVATWQPNVIFTPDPAQNGRAQPGLAGRLYLFGQKVDFPMIAEGSLTVELADRSKGGEPVVLEVWQFDKENLARLVRKDTIGWGFTLFLPWGTYRPDVNLVEMKVRFDPCKGTPLFAESTSVTLRNGGVPLPGEVQQTRALLPSRPSGGR